MEESPYFGLPTSSTLRHDIWSSELRPSLLHHDTSLEIEDPDNPISGPDGFKRLPVFRFLATGSGLMARIDEFIIEHYYDKENKMIVRNLLKEMEEEVTPQEAIMTEVNDVERLFKEIDKIRNDQNEGCELDADTLFCPTLMAPRPMCLTSKKLGRKGLGTRKVLGEIKI